ncbi:hypothetical protein Q7P37_003305 [Cladosporium fusiforme]
MADAADEDLFADLYDGEDAEPEAARPATEQAKPDTEAPAAITTAEASNDAPAPQQEDDDEAKPFDPSAEDMDGVANTAPANYDTQEVDRTPVHMKDDG